MGQQLSIYQQVQTLERKYCLLNNKINKLLLLQVNNTDNFLQSILNLVDSNSVSFEYLVDGKVTAHSSGGSGGANIEVVDNYSNIDQTDFTKRFIYIITDETNNNDSSLFIQTGSFLKYLLTVPLT